MGLMQPAETDFEKYTTATDNGGDTGARSNHDNVGVVIGGKDHGLEQRSCNRHVRNTRNVVAEKVG